MLIGNKLNRMFGARALASNKLNKQTGMKNDARGFQLIDKGLKKVDKNSTYDISSEAAVISNQGLQNFNYREQRMMELSLFSEKACELVKRSQTQTMKPRTAVRQIDDTYFAPHLKVNPSQINPIICTVGDPFRTEQVAKMCDEYEEVQWNREYRIFNVRHQRSDITVISHGIGGAGAAICFEELVKLGAQTIIRMGTCGGLKPQVSTGDLVVATAACREDGYSEYVAPKGFPAVADPSLTMQLVNEAEKTGLKTHLGVALTTSIFYPGIPSIPTSLQTNADSGAIAVEMEAATLFIIGALRSIKTAFIATADGNVFNENDYDPHGALVTHSKRQMIKAGLQVAANEARQSQGMGQQQQWAAAPVFTLEDDRRYLDFLRQSGTVEEYTNTNGFIDSGQKARIKEIVYGGFVTPLLQYMQQETSLDDDAIKEAILLFHSHNLIK